jgi:plastocyanin
MRAIARWQFAIVAAAAGLILAVSLATAAAKEPAPKPKPRHHTVTIDSTSYKPAALTVRAGDTIEWVNRDFYPHTVTAASGAFNSRDIAAGESWSYTAETAGSFEYICKYHQTMVGTLQVR